MANKGARKSYHEIGAVLESRDNPKEYYVKLKGETVVELPYGKGQTKTIRLPEGSTLSLQRPTTKIQRLLKSGHMTEKEAEEALNKVPSYVKYLITAAVPKSSTKSAGNDTEPDDDSF